MGKALQDLDFSVTGPSCSTGQRVQTFILRIQTLSGSFLPQQGPNQPHPCLPAPVASFDHKAAKNRGPTCSLSSISDEAMKLCILCISWFKWPDLLSTLAETFSANLCNPSQPLASCSSELEHLALRWTWEIFKPHLTNPKSPCGYLRVPHDSSLPLSDFSNWDGNKILYRVFFAHFPVSVLWCSWLCSPVLPTHKLP